MRGREVERHSEYQRAGPGVHRVGEQRLVLANVVGDQPDDEPDEGHAHSVGAERVRAIRAIPHSLVGGLRSDSCSPRGWRASWPRIKYAATPFHEEDTAMTKLYTYAGIAASVVLIAFGIGAV